ncbi:hypothetical protein ID866_13260 [Astraeus odoratus]|nr:hypothetical protein ID866_13260 [Astraeus odoratus]
MALQWFEPNLLSDSDPEDCPLWMDNWSEHELDCLQMKESQCINKYVVEFNHIASQLQGYRDGTLHHFYTGLPNCIKDEICHVGKP